MVGPYIYSLGPIASIRLKLCAWSEFQVHLLVLRITVLQCDLSTIVIVCSLILAVSLQSTTVCR